MQQALHTGAIDLAQQVLHLVGADTTGNILWRTRLTRQALRPFIAQLPPVLIGIDACGGAHDWARRVRSHQQDRREAEAIAEAVMRPARRVVPTQGSGQPDLPALPRGRERRSGERTALITNVHGLRHDDGSVLPTGVATCHHAVAETLESEQDTRTALGRERCGELGEACVA
jgi:transposase